MPVTANFRPLFGERLLSEYLQNWERQFRPTFTLPILGDIGAYPAPDDWNVFIADQVLKLERVAAQGTVVVLVQTVSDLLPSWADLVACPKVVISMSDGREPYAVGQYIVGQISVIDPDNLFPGTPDPAMPGHLAALAPFHYHHRPPRERPEATLRLVSLGDQQPGTPGLSGQRHLLEGQPRVALPLPTCHAISGPGPSNLRPPDAQDCGNMLL